MTRTESKVCLQISERTNIFEAERQPLKRRTFIPISFACDEFSPRNSLEDNFNGKHDQRDVRNALGTERSTVGCPKRRIPSEEIQPGVEEIRTKN